jgi:hypothetical protein
MNVPQITTFIIVIGCAGVLLGIAEVVLALLRRDHHIVRDVFIGVGFFVVGILILVLSAQMATEYKIDLGPVVNNICGVLLILFVFGMFVLKAAMNVREGQSRLKQENLSPFIIWISTFQSVSGIIVIVLFVFMLLLFFSQAFR